VDINAIRIRPSIASADPIRIADAVDSLGGWPYLHVDIEDGSFVPNITFGLKTAAAVAGYARQELDAHLLVADPSPYIAKLAGMGVKSLCFHMEAAAYPLETLGAIRRAGMRAGIALNFKTLPECLEPFLPSLDYALIMTAEPDGAGQGFSTAILPKIRRAKAMLTGDQRLWVDGGLHRGNIRLAVEAGATDIVVGRAAFENADAAAALRALADRCRD